MGEYWNRIRSNGLERSISRLWFVDVLSRSFREHGVHYLLTFTWLKPVQIPLRGQRKQRLHNTANLEEASNFEYALA
jgi:hypothetical protein